MVESAPPVEALDRQVTTHPDGAQGLLARVGWKWTRKCAGIQRKRGCHRPIPLSLRTRPVSAKTSATMYSDQDERLDKNTGTCDNPRRRTCDNRRQRFGVLELGVIGHTRTAIAQRNT